MADERINPNDREEIGRIPEEDIEGASEEEFEDVDELGEGEELEDLDEE